MDGSAPFQPWTSAGEGKGDDKSPYDARSSQFSAPACSPGSGSAHGMETGRPLDGPRAERMQHLVENTLSAEGRHQVSGLLAQISSLGPAERLLLYLKLPTGASGPAPDPLKQPLNPLGSRSEIHQTVMWIHTHLEVDPEISLPKQDVYDEYIEYCTHTKMKPLSTADFGKVMKQVYPCVKPRRLGTRGNSRYCYAGMRKRIKLETPRLPDLGEKQKTVEIPALQNDLLIAASLLIREWAEKALGIKFNNLCELAQHLVDKSYVDENSDAAILLADTQLLAESTEAGEGDSPHQRGVIKQLKRKIQSQPQLSPGKGGMGKKSRGEGAEPSPHIKPEHPPSYMPMPLALPYQPPHYPNLPINLSASGTTPPAPSPAVAPPSAPPPVTAPAVRAHPLPGKKIFLEAYNSENQLSSPRDYSPRAPASPAAPRGEYLPKKMRAIESFARLLPPVLQAPEPPFSLSTGYPSNDAGLNLSAAPQTPEEALGDIQQPCGYYPLQNALPPPQVTESMITPPKNTKLKGRKVCNVNSMNSTNNNNNNKGNEAPKPAQRGRPRKRSLSKAKYTRRRPPQTNNPAPPPNTDSCCGLADSIRGGIICGEKHSEILNRERVISICSMDKHALDDYLNEGNSQEHEEELMKYLPPEEDNPLNLNCLRDAPPGDVDGDEGSLIRKLDITDPGADTSALDSQLTSMQQSSVPGGDFLGSGMDTMEECNGSNDDKLSQIREMFHKTLGRNSCGPYDNSGMTGANRNNDATGEGFVPISPMASPFVSPRSTPRGRRPPLRPLKPPTNFPMSAPPSPNISKYRPCYEGGALRSLLQETAPRPCARPPLSAEPLCREVSQFFPDSGFTNRSQSVPLHGPPLQDFPPQPAPPPFASYNTTPCNSVPPTPTPADFCDFVNLGDTCDKTELIEENLDKIYNALYTTDSSVNERTDEELLGLSSFAPDLPGSPLGLEMGGSLLGLNEDARRDALRRSNSAECGSTIGSSYSESTPGASRSVPSTPADRCYSNRDFLINGNSLERSPPPAPPLPFQPDPPDLLSLGDLNKINSHLYYDSL